jgi:hypothetical protein
MWSLPSPIKPTALSRFFISLLCLLGLSAAAQRHRSVLLPDHIKLQYAGSIGFLSIGAGYANKRGSLEADLFYGHVPRLVSTTPLHSATVKLNWMPFKIDVSQRDRLRPLVLGTLGSYTFRSKNFGGEEAAPYFEHPKAMHIGFLAGSQVSHAFNRAKGPRGLGLYYEFVALDTEILNYMDNRKALTLDDILSLAIGLKLSF